MKREMVTIDGNEAAAYVAYHVNEVISIYPITPSSTMGELSDQWASEREPNIWGTVPHVTEMQSEGGAAGAVHGSLQRGALTTTFTASQGLLLMIPNMYKIAGELTSTVFHVSARSLATHALSIFCDHGDVMSVRSTGFALLASNSVQEVMDLALIAHAATLKSRVPFLHFFDGFRTSAETSKVERLSIDDLKKMIDEDLVRAHRARALSPDNPIIRGTSHNPDTYFQAREKINPYYNACPDLVQEVMDKFAKIVGRKYKLFQYEGAPDAERIIIIMGSGAETVEETVNYLNKRGEKVGVLKVRLFRPFSLKHFISEIPSSVKSIAVLDRTKEPGALGEPLYLDVTSAIASAFSNGMLKIDKMPKIIGGIYGLSSKEFKPSMVKAIFDELKKSEPKNRFTVGINDDITHKSLEYDPKFFVEPENRTRAVFFGLGADGTVSANKSSIKIIGEETDNYAQGFFFYDSKKAGSLTISHLRFGPEPIRSPYLIDRANFVACHQCSFLNKYDMLSVAEKDSIFLLNSPYPKDEVWNQLPKNVQQQIIDKNIKFYTIDAYDIAKDIGLGVRINTIMQTCFFALSNVIPKEEAIKSIKKFTEKTYGRKGEKILKMNYEAIDKAIDNLYEVKVPEKATSSFDLKLSMPEEAPDYVKNVISKMIVFKGDELPVSAFPDDGTYPTGTTKWEKRNISLDVPVWDPEICIQCGKCAFVCPHAVIRAKVYPKDALKNAPASFKYVEARFSQFKDYLYTIQASPEDCTGCKLCYETCPSKNKQDPMLKAINMEFKDPILDREKENWNFFESLPYVEREKLNFSTVKDIQLLEPLFEFSGACSGCGQTPYVKLMTQLFGDRAIIANATGCSSIYGGNLPTTPYTKNKDGRGPTWSNSLFEDTAEFGLGMRLALDKQKEYAIELVDKLKDDLGKDLVFELKNTNQDNEAGIQKQREMVKLLKAKLKSIQKPEAKDLLSLADSLVKKSVWMLGGDGWAYDIGYGGLDHVLALGKNVNILVLDTEVYSNTGGQMSKATPLGAVAKFAMGGKSTSKKDLAMMAMSYGNVYVAKVAFGANNAQTVKAFLEAEAYEGTSIIIAYSHCINQGYDLIHGPDQQKAAVQSGYWPLLRYNPNLEKEGKNPLQLDSGKPSLPIDNYVYNETRFKVLLHSNPEIAKKFLEDLKKDIQKKWSFYKYWSEMPVSKEGEK
ncbi:MAG: Ketoisovalerate oxidoreductase subunit VorA [Candidatus Methanofastidiosum methylothiophilum]|uniref:Ketoisovalerate oxidoreductase subunit VorA n=1 Tax=Candidatus Methanofastidiosum methylothiophilum TaxID=1705564 RepID=A0A150IZZ7_9EURY|nr:MAG: Ketoisovalerate oxidoreductase subunit VorA [Candidatus Methanofastidiosum methylthiophilus]KYC47945.1 MAG: Ketoisovalerate oxidoreductase subunit VorA [Candidatus Methanofastidiosum methylthiophilus]KYC50563.1 MAG: Ketoisovalerate oxidoreductase subunit VorA [Candidatus Methanofastidiosum methylthiophilus]